MYVQPKDRLYNLRIIYNFVLSSVTGFLTFINCYDVKFTTKLQNMFMFTKIAALLIVIIAGVAYMSLGMNIERFVVQLAQTILNGTFQFLMQGTRKISKNHSIIQKRIQANYR